MEAFGRGRFPVCLWYIEKAKKNETVTFTDTKVSNDLPNGLFHIGIDQVSFDIKVETEAHGSIIKGFRCGHNARFIL